MPQKKSKLSAGWVCVIGCAVSLLLPLMCVFWVYVAMAVFTVKFVAEHNLWVPFADLETVIVGYFAWSWLAWVASLAGGILNLIFWIVVIYVVLGFLGHRAG